MSLDQTAVRDFMRKKYCSFSSDDNIFDAVERMQKYNISGGAVLDEEQKCVGFLSEQDCIQALLQASYHCEMTATAGDLMHEEVLTVDADMSIVDLASLFSVNKPKLYPVVSGGKVVGIVCRAEVIEVLLESGKDCHLSHKTS